MCTAERHAIYGKRAMGRGFGDMFCCNSRAVWHGLVGSRAVEGSACWHANKLDGRCSGYESVGYKCVGTNCAAMETDLGSNALDPGQCATLAPAGYTIDGATGTCVQRTGGVGTIHIAVNGGEASLKSCKISGGVPPPPPARPLARAVTGRLPSRPCSQCVSA
jgi:hypothetical protein